MFDLSAGDVTVFEQIETLYSAVRCLEGYQIELEQMERLGSPLTRILPAPRFGRQDTRFPFPVRRKGG